MLKPMLIISGGLPGAGKTAITRGLARQIATPPLTGKADSSLSVAEIRTSSSERDTILIRLHVWRAFLVRNVRERKFC
jgi:tRNA uridine 5-carbamoylmethylation protein Kti12